ncbi:dynein axonemal assembly factor 8-like [Bolinopsis microptera]|uniref:dynein axonemal assembly factor 8-like n=1 Tax=Bolinopsis microptera TaxID=2820187 RepID=UPI003079DD27
MSETPEHAYKLASLLFFEKELYSDEIMRPKQLHLPPPRTHVNSIISKEGRHHLSDLPDRLVYQSEGILKSMLAPPRLLASILVTSQVNHFGKILKRLEQEEFTVVGVHLTRDTDSIVFCVQAENCIYKLLQLVGPRDLKEAKSSHQFSLRASFATHSDSFYASPTYNDSVTDVKRYFPDGLCCANTLDMQAEGIPHSYIDELVNTASARRYVSRSYPLKPLLQTVCVVFPPDLLRPAKHMRLSPASQLITMIQSCQFEIVNVRLLTIPTLQIQPFRTLFKVHYELSQTFVNRPCLLLVLQRENAASCFSQILQGYSNTNNRKLLDSYDHMMLTSTNKQTCENQIKFFFDFLPDRCKDQMEIQ